MEGFTSGRSRSKRFAVALGLSLAASALAPAADTPPDAVRVTAVRFWSLGETTRIAIEVSSEFHFKYERLDNPSRLFFDIFGAKPSMARGIQTIHVDDGTVRQLRIAETQPGVTRVVVDLVQPAGMTTSQLSNPDRLMIEVKPEAKLTDKSNDKSPVPSPKPNAPASASAKPAAAAGALPTVQVPTVQVPTVQAAAVPATTRSAPRAPEAAVKPEPAAKVDAPKLPAAAVRVSETKPGESASFTEVRNAGAPKPPVSGKPAELVKAVEPSKANDAKTSEAKSNDTAALPPEPLGVEPARTREDVQAVLPAKRGTIGDRSLTRALGLKLGRVVIDPGHGGHDVGTHGPSGYLEKDLSLDVARRLVPLIEERMGSEVILTRADDTYVGLEERTRIANDRKADLFLSIHANSSSYRAAAGVETYILNFTTSKSAMDLAARENASSDLAIHDLQDLLQKIALRDKIEESNELAASLQTSLSVLSTRSNEAAKNRGVKKAPFVVLIGATMPSVLAEIGFLSNTSDEALLRKPEHRQKIAEALYKGIASYAGTLSQVVARRN